VASFIEAGRTLARDASIEAVIAFFTPTLKLDPDRTRDPETEARQIIALGLVAEGQALARAGEMVTATALFSQALAYDSSLDLDPEKEAQRLRALFLVEEGQTLAEEGEIEKALAAYAQAQVYNPDVEIDAGAWNSLCWFGSLYGYAEDVLFACEEAVALAPQDGEIRDNRGLARALTGDTEGAIEDFRFAVGAWQAQEVCEYQPCEQREAWIAELEAGGNPFDEETLKELRGE
jgi:tetratricopeptide (TPR) repeat protein